MNKDRLNYIKEYYNQQKVKVEVPVQKHETSKGIVYYYFTGERCGYRFRHGFAMVDRKDLHRFRENFPSFIIHDEEGVEND